MQWWNSFVSWLTEADTQPVLFGALVFIFAIVVSSVLAAGISRGAIRRVLDQRDREIKASAIGTLIDAATEASVWNSLTPQEQVMSDRAVGQADIQVRMLPIKGASVAANWAAHELAELKRTSATFGYQLEPALFEFRDRLIEWQGRPSRARKIFQSDLDRWKMQNTSSEKSLLAEQDAWVAQQHHDQYSAPESAATPTSTPTNYVPTAPAANTASYEPTTAPAPYAPLNYTNGSKSPSTETQRLLDDVTALEVRPAQTQTAPTL